MRAFEGFAATSPVVWTEALSALSRLTGALSRHGEVMWPPTAETSDANAIHGEIASAAPSRQAVTARSAN